MNIQLAPLFVVVILLLYFGMLLAVAWFTGRNNSNSGFFLANRSVPWYVVAYAMIGTSISGVTFISLPGKVGLSEGVNRGFGYMQVVLGYLFGYLFIATVLMPLYYRLNLTSIYGYLEQRLGRYAYKTGAAFFILARTLGSAARMFLAAFVLQSFVFDALHVPFPVTVVLMLALIYAYTFKGGLKTIIWTDSIMTTFFLVAVVLTVFTIGKALDLNGLGEIWNAAQNSRYSQVFFFDNFLSDPNHFVKQVIFGALVAIAMTGLDQDLMQKNLACKNIREAQKNMAVFCFYLIVINLAFLLLGALLYLFATARGLDLPTNSDHLYPLIAFYHLNKIAVVFFVLGLVGSTYASSDSALTALTTSFCVDFLNFEKHADVVDHYASETEKIAQAAAIEARQKRTRTLVHLSFSAIFALIIILLHAFSKTDVLSLVFKFAGYTYGPLLGLFAFGLLSDLQVRDRFVPIVCIAAPLLTIAIESWCKSWLDVGFLTILINGLITLFGLWAISYRVEGK